MADSYNDNNAASTAGPDAHGQAAYLLIESLIHTLVARSVIPLAVAVDVVEVASDVNAEIVEDIGVPQPALHRSLDILRSLAASLRVTPIR